MNTMNIANAKRNVYRISPVRLWLVPVMSVAFAGFLLFLGLDPSKAADMRTIVLSMAGIAFVFAIVMYLILRRTRLVVSSSGVELYQFGYKLETGWDNIASLDDESGFEGLVLHRPMDCPGAHRLSRFRNATIKGVSQYTGDQIQLLAEHRFIPLAAFAYALKNGRLRDDLTRRAPALNNG